jgi:hypothetical protein
MSTVSLVGDTLVRTRLISFALALYVLLPWQEAHSQLAACIIIEIPADAEAPIGDARDKVKSLRPTAEHDAFGGAEKQATRLSTPHPENNPGDLVRTRWSQFNQCG